MRVLYSLVLSLAVVASDIAAADQPLVLRSSEANRLLLTGSDATGPAFLSVVGAEPSVPLEIERQSNGAIELVSAWPLMEGVDYQVTLGSGPRAITLPVVAAPSVAPEAGVARIAPGASTVPENLLRFHIFFETPMARGQVRDHIHLLQADGTSVPDAFLDLRGEIWSTDQRRLTLLFDPGRIKQGVGPNRVLGAPLVAGQVYALTVDAGMRDAAGAPLSVAVQHEFTVGPPLRSAIAMQDWLLQVDGDDLSVDFGREMDAASVARHVALVGPDGTYELPGNGPNPVWDLSDWPEGTPLRLIASPLLEDVAGNTLCVPFDVAAGEATRCTEDSRFEIEVTR